MSFADILDEEAQSGYQRPCDRRHAQEFRSYIEQPGATTIPLTFNLRGRPGVANRLGRFVTAVRDGYDGPWRLLEANVQP